MAEVNSHDGLRVVRADLIRRRSLANDQLKQLEASLNILRRQLAEINHAISSLDDVERLLNNTPGRGYFLDACSENSPIRSVLPAVMDAIVDNPYCDLEFVNSILPFGGELIRNALTELSQTGMVAIVESGDRNVRFVPTCPQQKVGVTDVILATLRERRAPVRLEELKAAVSKRSSTSTDNLSEKVSATLSGLVNRNVVLRVGPAIYTLHPSQS